MGCYVYSISIQTMKVHRYSDWSDVMTTERQKTETDLPAHDLLTAALGYASKGFRIFPLHSVDDHGHCSCGKQDCGSPGKHPRNYNGLKGATTDETQILKWWKKFPDANIAIRTGKGLLVLDVDEDEGEDSLRELEEKHERLPETWECLTGRGRHILPLIVSRSLHQEFKKPRWLSPRCPL
jgi:Bifunctional DNA primase/polymerase, N-terminal